MTFGQRLKRLRYKLGLSQKEMADRLGVHLMTISRYERDAMKPSFKFLEKIRETFNVNPQWLLEGVGEMFLPKDKPTEAVKAELLGLKGASLDSLAEELAEIVVAEAMMERGIFLKKEVALYDYLHQLAKKKLRACHQAIKAEIGFHIDILDTSVNKATFNEKPKSSLKESSPESE